MAYASFAELLSASVHCGSLGTAALELEAEESGTDPAELRGRMLQTLGVMRDAVSAGLAGDVMSRSGFVGGDARQRAISRDSGLARFSGTTSVPQSAACIPSSAAWMD